MYYVHMHLCAYLYLYIALAVYPCTGTYRYVQGITTLYSYYYGGIAP